MMVDDDTGIDLSGISQIILIKEMLGHTEDLIIRPAVDLAFLDFLQDIVDTAFYSL
jgi:hypothetical protein